MPKVPRENDSATPKKRARKTTRRLEMAFMRTMEKAPQRSP
jgi:hypothetical protein